MKKSYERIRLTLYFVLVGIASYSQEKLPVNPATKLISINKVVEVNGKHIQALKQIAVAFIAENSVNDPVNFIPKTATSKVRFHAAKVLELDSSLVYVCQYIMIYDNQRSENELQKADIIEFKINFYFKASKVKYDITSFSHRTNGIQEQFRGGAFENEAPETNVTKRNREKWQRLKNTSITQANSIAEAIEQYFLSADKNQTDF
jgi:hypothetical protein